MPQSPEDTNLTDDDKTEAQKIVRRLEIAKKRAIARARQKNSPRVAQAVGKNTDPWLIYAAVLDEKYKEDFKKATEQMWEKAKKGKKSIAYAVISRLWWGEQWNMEAGGETEERKTVLKGLSKELNSFISKIDEINKGKGSEKDALGLKLLQEQGMKWKESAKTMDENQQISHLKSEARKLEEEQREQLAEGAEISSLEGIPADTGSGSGSSSNTGGGKKRRKSSRKKRRRTKKRRKSSRKKRKYSKKRKTTKKKH